tara:strand:- start:229 stop:420 length:192 start_codon:yes stop_codon:yes gene_type:complete
VGMVKNNVDKFLKGLSIAVIIILVLNIILVLIGRSNGVVFWFVIIACALVAYKGIPYLRKVQK